MKVKSESEVAQSCRTLSDPMDCSPPSSSVHGIFQARVLEWGAIEVCVRVHFFSYACPVLLVLFLILQYTFLGIFFTDNNVIHKDERHFFTLQFVCLLFLLFLLCLLVPNKISIMKMELMKMGSSSFSVISFCPLYSVNVRIAHEVSREEAKGRVIQMIYAKALESQ